MCDFLEFQPRARCVDESEPIRAWKWFSRHVPEGPRDIVVWDSPIQAYPWHGGRMSADRQPGSDEHGIYAFTTKNDAVNYARSFAFGNIPVLPVDLWGGVIEHVDEEGNVSGYRAQHARIV